jgi:hypothetical protein
VIAGGWGGIILAQVQIERPHFWLRRKWAPKRESSRRGCVGHPSEEDQIAGAACG